MDNPLIYDIHIYKRRDLLISCIIPFIGRWQCKNCAFVLNLFTILLMSQYLNLSTLSESDSGLTKQLSQNDSQSLTMLWDYGLESMAQSLTTGCSLMILEKYQIPTLARKQSVSLKGCHQVSKPEMELHLINKIHAALPMRAQTEKTTFSCKDG